MDSVAGAQALPTAPPQDDQVVSGGAVPIGPVLMAEAVKAARSNDCESAITILEHAAELQYDLVAKVYLGVCYLKEGYAARSYALIAAVLNDPRLSNASRQYRNIRSMAVSTKLRAEARIARVRFVTRSEGAKGHVYVDDQIGSTHNFDDPIALEPGIHTVHAEAPGFEPLHQVIEVKAGEDRAIEVNLVPTRAEAVQLAADVKSPRETVSEENATKLSPEAHRAPVAPPVKPMTRRGPRDETTRSEAGSVGLPVYVAAGVGIVGLAVGTAFGISAFETHSELGQVCPANRCPPEVAGQLERAHVRATVANIGFGVGLAGALAGGLLYLLSGSPHQDEPVALRSSVSADLAPLSVKFMTRFE